MRSVPQSFYKGREWKRCQADYMTKVNHLCERCKREGKYVPAAIVHHKIHLTTENMKDPAIAYGFDNLEALCLDCHNKEHFGDRTPKRYKIVNGELIF